MASGSGSGTLRSVSKTAAIAAGLIGGALVVVLTMAPASLLASAIRSNTQGRVDLGEPSGTIWDGEANIILAEKNIDDDRGGPKSTPFRTSLPGRTSWQINPWRLLVGTLQLHLANSAILRAPLDLRIERGPNATIDAGHLTVPAGLLIGLGAPWNTIRPGGDLVLDWDTLHLESGALHGGIRVEWVGASSGLSPIVPFGHYRLQTDGYFDGAHIQLETIAGPMEMVGNGTIAGGSRLHFRGTAGVQPGTDPAVATQLSGLITLLGRREGDEAILSFGT
jgi:general secretion pathway protein N